MKLPASAEELNLQITLRAMRGEGFLDLLKPLFVEIDALEAQYQAGLEATRVQALRAARAEARHPFEGLQVVCTERPE